MAGLLGGIGDAVSKLTQWIPSRRESLVNTIEKLKQEMKDVQDRKPFDAARYIKLADQLCKAEGLEKRAS